MVSLSKDDFLDKLTMYIPSLSRDDRLTMIARRIDLSPQQANRGPGLEICQAYPPPTWLGNSCVRGSSPEAVNIRTSLHAART